jgi:hypothetical protein
MFVSEFAVHNSSSEPVQFGPFSDGCNLATCTPTVIPPHTTLFPAVSRPRPGTPPALLFLANTSGLQDLTFALRVRDTSRSDKGWGTEIPVIVVSAVRSGPIALVNVPIANHFRQTLRVYGVSATRQLVNLRFFAIRQHSDNVADGTTPITERQIALVQPVDNRVQPSYYALDLGNQVPELAGNEAVRIDVVPETSDFVWAMVSITNNETQEITVVTPGR